MVDGVRISLPRGFGALTKCAPNKSGTKPTGDGESPRDACQQVGLLLDHSRSSTTRHSSESTQLEAEPASQIDPVLTDVSRGSFPASIDKRFNSERISSQESLGYSCE